MKRTSGVITCGNHFDAWEKAGMKIGTFYEVSFNVEAYQSGGGSADMGRRELSAGRQTIRFDAPKIPCGAYYYAIKKCD